MNAVAEGKTVRGPGEDPPALKVEGLCVRYGNSGSTLREVSLEVPAGSIVSLLGPNGAGKTTMMRAVSGLLGLHRGTVTAGTVDLFGVEATHLRASRRVRAGLAQCLEGRMVFPGLTAEENLAAGGHVRRFSRAAGRQRRDEVLDRFPRLRDLLGRKAGYLSGGEQQMLVIARALMSQPKLLLLDEPSLGLAPKIVEQVAEVIRSINEDGTSILLVEQNASMALSIADHGYVLESGTVGLSGTPAELRSDPRFTQIYLGGAVGAAGSDAEGSRR